MQSQANIHQSVIDFATASSWKKRSQNDDRIKIWTGIGKLSGYLLIVFPNLLQMKPKYSRNLFSSSKPK
jgi:hypothetical protein